MLTGQPAPVTGANSGIDKAVALGLARAWADVVVNYVTHPEATDAVVRHAGLYAARVGELEAALNDPDLSSRRH